MRQTVRRWSNYCLLLFTSTQEEVVTRTREEALSMIQVRHAILKIVFWHMMLACLGRVAISPLRYHYTPHKSTFITKAR
jgi:hypothetical protein